MATRRQLTNQGTLVLDCEGFSKLVNDHRATAALVNAARGRGIEVVISALTIIEASHRRTNATRLNWILSSVRVVQVTEKEAKAAASLLINLGLHGHKYAIDAVIAEMASRQQRPVVMLTSDTDDMKVLCDDHVQLSPV